MDVLSLSQALAAVRDHRSRGGQPLRVGLACGFTPLHAATFLAAQLGLLRVHGPVEVAEGTYGDLAVAVGDLTGQGLAGVVVALDWPDLDPRLALRSPGAGAAAEDVLGTAERRLARIEAALAALAGGTPTVLVLPVTPPPPALRARADQLSPAEARLRALLTGSAARLAAEHGVRVVADQPAVRGDLRADLRQGTPWTTRQAATAMRTAAALLAPPPPKKALITDLDDTLWRGLVGEVGAAALTWDLDAGSQVHALYQRLLHTLAAEGVLLAVCSKNDDAPVREALARPDLLVAADRFFPVVASWDPKSRGVETVLAAWNIGAADVVVVDDNPRELAEIATVHPDITTVQFPTHDANAALRMLDELRALFWRDGGSADDALRLDSLRAAADLRAERAEAPDEETFLADLDATVAVQLGARAVGSRAYELTNKTNQFNLNGRRHDAASWTAALAAPGAVCATVGYTDRFGALGTISVLLGRVADSVLLVDSWVLSCRAFSRRIEHHLLAGLARELGVESVEFAFEPTARNGPAAAFLTGVGAGSAPFRLVAQDLLAGPDLHRVQVAPAAPEG